MWLCPNASCPETGRYKQGESCKKCGQPVKDFPKGSFSHIASKMKAGKKTQRQNRANKAKEKLIEELVEVPSTPQTPAGEKPESKSIEEMAKVIIDQNKSLIQQNELMMKALANKNSETSEEE